MAAVLAASGALLSVNACASDEVVAMDPVDSGGELPDTLTPAPDADVGDAGVDVDASVPPRTCSSEGFCHFPLPVPQSLRAVWGDGTGIVWAVGAEGGIFRWDGTAWALHATVKGALSTIWGSSPTNIWIGGESGLLHGEGAASDKVVFAAVPYESSIPITSIHGFGPSDIWAVGGRADWQTEESLVLHYAGPTGDPTADWHLDPVSSRLAAFSTVWGSSPDDVWLGGSTVLGDPQGAVVLHGHSDGAGGTSFETVKVYTGRFSRNMLTVAGGVHLPEDFIVGRDWSGLGVVWTGSPHASDAGDGGDAGVRAWDGEVFGYGMNAIWGTSKSDIWVAGSLGRVRHWDGTTWLLAKVSIEKFPLVKDLYGIWAKGPDDFWIVGDNVTMRKSAPGGDK